MKRLLLSLILLPVYAFGIATDGPSAVPSKAELGFTIGDGTSIGVHAHVWTKQGWIGGVWGGGLPSAGGFTGPGAFSGAIEFGYAWDREGDSNQYASLCFALPGAFKRGAEPYYGVLGPAYGLRWNGLRLQTGVGFRLFGTSEFEIVPLIQVGYSWQVEI